jgi:hypothetical protein
MAKVPAWLSVVNTEFVCCKDKTLRSITELRAEELQPHAVRNEVTDLAGVDAFEEEEAEAE